MGEAVASLERAGLAGGSKGVEACREWIRRHCVPRKTINKQTGSYSLKHRIENDVYIYISNGACIVAFILEGYQVYHPQSWGPNCAFNVKFLTDNDRQLEARSAGKRH